MKTSMIVHFVVDEKITDQIIENFLSVSDNNVFIVFVKDRLADYKHIKTTNDNIRKFDYTKDNILETLEEVKPSALILHSLRVEFAAILSANSFNVKIAWVAWGFDVYSLPKIKPHLFAPQTRKQVMKSDPFTVLKWQIKKLPVLRRIQYRLIKGKRDPYSLLFKAIRSIDYFCTYIKEDFDYFSKHYPQNKLTFVETAFSTIDQYLAGNKQLSLAENANNILIGNSNTPESNYLDVIDILADFKEEFNKACFVLNYGCNDKHKKEVIENGNNLLGDQFSPVLNFMDRESYIEFLRSCSVGVFNHYRQQAMGNIIAMIYLGARVYLSEKNPAYHYFIRNGVIVNCFETEFYKFLNAKLNHIEIQNNRSIMDSLFSKEKVLNDLRTLTSRLLL